jgi:uncharacterized protein (TIGR00730 family)
MQAAHEGAGPEHAFGVNIRLPFEQKPNWVVEGSHRLITYKYFFNRKVAFLKEADAVALFPGGFGTLDEAMETLTLLQTGKRNPMPLVLVDEPNGTYWSQLIRFMQDEILSRNYISNMDFSIFEQVGSAEEAVTNIKKFYGRYHSLRYVDGRLVIRLTSPMPADRLARLRQEFADILLPGGNIAPVDASPAEIEDNDYVNLPRIALDFNRKDFGMLRCLIDRINEA